MGFRALERMLVPERLKRRAAHTGFALPAMEERPTTQEEGPYLVTNMRASFLPTRMSSTGSVRFGFSTVTPENDDKLLTTLHRSLTAQAAGNPCPSVEAAIQRLLSRGYEARTMVLPESWLPEICGPDFDVSKARELMSLQGYVTKLGEVQVLVADLPSNMAFVAAAPALVGLYTRVADAVGVIIFRADRSIVAVTRDVGE